MIDAPGPWGTGPFVLADGISTLEERSPRVVMEPNDTYWDPDRKPRARIVYDNETPREEALRSVAEGDGRVDVVLDVTLREAAAFEGSGGKIQAKPAKTVMAGAFNRAKPDSPWADPALRRAANLAIDRERLVAEAAGGRGVHMPVMIQPGRYGHDPRLQPYGHDPEAARRAFEEAGMAGRTVMLLASRAWEPVARFVAASLEAVGLVPDVRVMASGEEEEPEGWDIKLVWYFDWSPQFPVGVVHREFFGRDGQFLSGPPVERFDAYYQQLLRAPHQPQQEELVREIERFLHDEAWALFLFSPNTLAAVSDRVEFTAYDTCMSELAETRVR